MKKSTKDLTVGTPWKAIIMFALPLLGSSLIQQMYGTVDLFFVSRYLGTNAASAVGASDLLVTCLVGLFTGISVGSNVVAAQAFGAKDKERLHELIQTMVTFGVIGALVLLAIGELFAPTFLQWLNTPESIQPLAVTYLRIYFLCIFSIVLYNLCSGVVRALGDSAAAMRFQIYGGLANVVMDFLMIVFLKWGVAGAALATFLSQTTAAFFTIRYLMRLEKEIRLDLKQPMINGYLLKKVLAVGIPSGVQSMIVTFANLLVQAVINGFGVAVIAAFVVYFKVELFIWYPLVAIGQALVTYTAQNIGAGRKDRVKSGAVTGVILGVVVCLVLGNLLRFFAPQIFGLFNPDTEVIEAGVSIVSVTFPLYFLCCFQDAFGSVLKGFGNGTWPMVVSVCFLCIFRVVILYAFNAKWHTIATVAAVYPITWAAAGLFMFLALLIFMRKYNQGMNRK